MPGAFTTPPITRFPTHIKKVGNCLVWSNYIDHKGYPIFCLGARWKGQSLLVRAHRWIWEFTFGSIPKGFEMHHVCKNRACVNLDHLQPLSRYDHMVADGVHMNAVNAHRAKTHCPSGHPYDEQNTYMRVDSKGWRGRTCRKCHATHEQKRRNQRRLQLRNTRLAS